MNTKLGTYALILESKKDFATQVGKLGRFIGKPGYYIYIGSAFGLGGMEARLNHHRKLSLNPRWHIDYIRGYLALKEIWLTHDTEKREHDWANILIAMSNTVIPYADFGASDCTCPTHLFYYPEILAFETFVCKAVSVFKNHACIKRIEG